MLVLGRRPGESIYIGDDIILTIVRIEKDYIRIAIEAPSNLKILREELVPYDKTKKLKSKS